MNIAPFRLDQFEWTAERIGELKAYIKIGKTASQVAKIMGINRLTVIRAMARVMGRAETKPDPDHEKEPRVEIRTVTPVTLAAKPPPSTFFFRAVRTELIHKPSHPVELLTNATCRYPFGEVGKPGFRFCMAPVRGEGAPYCREHWIATTGRYGRG